MQHSKQVYIETTTAKSQLACLTTRKIYSHMLDAPPPHGSFWPTKCWKTIPRLW